MSSELERARQRGADVEQIPDLVEIEGLVDALKEIVAQRSEEHAALIDSISKLTTAISDRKDLDLSELITTVADLRQQVQVPYDYEMTFDRDQRYMIKSGIRFIAKPAENFVKH